MKRKTGENRDGKILLYKLSWAISLCQSYLRVLYIVSYRKLSYYDLQSDKKQTENVTATKKICLD